VGQEFAGAIDNGHFTAGAKSRIDADRHVRTGGGSQQQFAQVLGKHGDRFFVRPFLRLLQGRGFGRRQQQAAVAVLGRLHQFVVEFEPRIGDPLLPERAQHGIVVQFQADAQHVFRFAPFHGQQPVRRHSLERFPMVEVHRELAAGVVLAAADLSDDPTRLGRLLDQPTPRLGVLRPMLGHDVARALQGGGFVRNILLGRYERPQDIGLGPTERLLPQEQIGQRLQASFASDRGPRSPLGLERQVQIFQLFLVLAHLDPPPQSTVSCPCSSIVLRMVVLRWASSRALSSASSMKRSACSSKPCVASLR
jgi:hypothetical protein